MFEGGSSPGGGAYIEAFYTFHSAYNLLKLVLLCYNKVLMCKAKQEFCRLL